jgi:peptidoglycan/LPS O-acetylase OafA/YrhL
MAQRRFAIADSPFLDLVKLSASILTAALSWYCIEAPILRLKDRLAYDPRRRERELASARAPGGELVAERAD